MSKKKQDPAPELDFETREQLLEYFLLHNSPKKQRNLRVRRGSPTRGRATSRANGYVSS